MSHIKDRLSDYHDFMKKLADDNQIVLSSDVLEMIEQLQEDLEQDEKENGWIPVKYHQMSEKEREEECISKDIQYMLDCKMPDDGQEILVTNGEMTWQDICCIDSDGYYLDSNYDWIKITGWRPLPEPYKENQMGRCKLDCPYSETQCCIYCEKQDGCDRRCDTMDSYECVEDCEDYVKE